MTTHNDEICYAKHFLDLFVHFFTLFWCGGGGGGGLPRGLGHNLLMQFSRLGSSKMEISKTDFLIFWPSKMIKYPMSRGPLVVGTQPQGGGGGVSTDLKIVVRNNVPLSAPEVLEILF